jgi:CS domain
MSKLLDYSKFDHIGSDDDDDDDVNEGEAYGRSSAASSGAPRLVPTEVHGPPQPQTMTKKGKEGRLVFEHEGRTIYEWEQSLEEVNIFIEPPEGLPRELIAIVIGHRHLTVGVKGAPPFIDEDTFGAVKPDESLWTIADGEIMISLQKVFKAEAWDSALLGRTGQTVDPVTKEEVKKKLMLERFQEEVRSPIR